MNAESQPTSADSSPRPSPALKAARSLVTARELKVAAGVFGALTLVFLIFGRLNWTIGGELELQSTSAGLVAVVQVPETDIALASVGQPVHIRLRAYPGTDISGQVQSIGNSAAPAGADPAAPVTVPVTLSLSPPPGVTLRAGFTGSAEIVVARDRAGFVLWGRFSRYLLQLIIKR